MPLSMANVTGKHRKKRRHHGEGTVIERRDHWRRSRWAAVVPYTDESGRRRTMWRSASSESEAEALRKELVRQLAVGVPAKSFVETFGEYVSAWLDGRRDHLAPGSWDRYRSHLEQRILPTLGAVPMAELTIAAIRTAAGRWSGSPATREGTIVVLRAALRDAERDGLIEANPARFLRPPRNVTAPRVALDVEDARRLLAAAKGDRLSPLLVTTLGLGLRRGEALGMQTADVDLDAGTVRIFHSLRRIPVSFRAEGEEATRIVAPKHGSYGVLPIPAFVADVLRERLADLRAERKASRVYAPNDLVFCLPSGNPISFSRLDRWFRVIVERAGLPHMRFHDVRGSTATILLAEGVDIRTVQAILRHKNIQQTIEYTKALPRVSKDAARRLSEAMG